MGYAYAPRFRIHPSSGGDTTYLLTQGTDPSTGAVTGKFPSSIVVTYEPEKVQAVTPEKRIVEKRWGVRPVVRMGFQVYALANEAWLADVISACGDDTKTVYLSLNNGTTEREVVLEGNYERAPLAGKAAAGIEVVVTFKAADVIATVPTIGSGSW